MGKVILTITVLIFTSVHSNSQGWFQQTSGTTVNLNSVFFVDANTGYAVGDSTIVYHIILKTTNGGTNWFRQNVQPPNNYPSLKSVFFINANTGWACGAEAPTATIWRTTNGGSEWTQLIIGAIFGLRSIRFINSSTGVAVGSAYSSAGWIFRSTNGGINWSQLAGAGNILHSVYFADAVTGYSCGEPGAIIKTTNAGVNWVIQTSNTTTSLRSIYFINPQTGWTVGTNSRVYKTTNGGSQWADLSSNGLCGLYSVYFADASTGWVAGCEGSIHRTTNGGASWQLQSIASTSFLYSLSFINSNTGWAVGANGRILKTTTGGLTPITPISSEVPEDFSLFQNYPNPFNPGTKIRFAIPNVGTVPRTVRLIIYDALGREITTLVNEQLNPGTYEVDWDASNYPSGVYFYKLIADDYTATKKMVLIK